MHTCLLLHGKDIFAIVADMVDKHLGSTPFSPLERTVNHSYISIHHKLALKSHQKTFRHTLMTADNQLRHHCVYERHQETLALLKS